MSAPTIRTNSVAAAELPAGGAPLRVSSRSYAEGEDIPMAQVFTGCGGQNRSPQLSWTGAPPETRSFAITMFDPDAPTGCGFWHWLVFDIPASTTSLDENAGASASPAGGHSGYTDFSMNGYGGPCPPQGHGKHHYILTVYALDVAALAGADAGITGARLVFSMRGHILAQGSITALFGH
jgi:Raf kinase inhibitor-like YbhB/YbcL family protein